MVYKGLIIPMGNKTKQPYLTPKRNTFTLGVSLPRRIISFILHPGSFGELKNMLARENAGDGLRSKVLLCTLTLELKLTFTLYFLVTMATSKRWCLIGLISCPCISQWCNANSSEWTIATDELSNSSTKFRNS